MIASLYDRTIRPALPRKFGVFNGVAVRTPRLFDRTDCVADYKAGLIDAIDECVRVDDHVVDIATGYGVAAVVAGRHADAVTTYEAAAEWVDRATETLAANNVSETVTVEHALVGEGRAVDGQFHGADYVAPSELDPGDVLVLDCEGAEASILDGLETWPRTVICEAHRSHGVPAEATVRRLGPHYPHISIREQYPGRQDDDERVIVATRGDNEW
jgi:hypothetical protein